MTFHILHIPYYNTLIPTKCRELLERILRETLENNNIESSTILYLWFLNSSTLTLSIDIPLKGSLAKSLSHHTYISEEVFFFLVLGKQFKEDQFIWLMQWAYYGIRKVKEDTVRLNLVGARSLEGLGTLSRLSLESLLLFVYSNFIL